MVGRADKLHRRWLNVCVKRTSPVPLAAYVIHVRYYPARTGAVVQRYSPTLARIGLPTVVFVHRASTDRIVTHVSEER